ncbi:hypothetical protein ACS0TY_020334 [Phlomoides rotata]
MSIIVEGSTLSSPLVASTRFHESSYRIRIASPSEFRTTNPKPTDPSEKTPTSEFSLRTEFLSSLFLNAGSVSQCLLTISFSHLKNDCYKLYTRFTLSDTGVGQRWIWENQNQGWISYLTLPSDNCDIYNVCGAHSICDIENTPNCRCLNKFKPKDPERWGLGDSSNECIRRTPLNCENEDSFSKYSGVKLPNNRRTWYNTTMTLEECKVKCLNNCSCTAYTSLNISRGKTGCLIWFGDLVDIREMTPGQDIYIRLRRKETKNTYSGIFPGNRNTSPKREPDVVFVEKKEVEASASGKRKDETEQHG